MKVDWIARGDESDALFMLRHRWTDGFCALIMYTFTGTDGAKFVWSICYGGEMLAQGRTKTLEEAKIEALKAYGA